MERNELFKRLSRMASYMTCLRVSLDQGGDRTDQEMWIQRMEVELSEMIGQLSSVGGVVPLKDFISVAKDAHRNSVNLEKTLGQMVKEAEGLKECDFWMTQEVLDALMEVSFRADRIEGDLYRASQGIVERYDEFYGNIGLKMAMEE